MRPIASLVIESTRRGFPTVAACRHEWAHEPRGEVADALEAFGYVRALAALREAPGEARDRHQAVADEQRRVAAALTA
jgi:hypothetical protein